MDVLVEPESESATLPSPAQSRALEAFLALGPNRLAEWTHPVALDCQYACLRMKMEGGKPPFKLRQRNEVWRHVRLTQVTVPQHGATADRYVFVDGECDWEEEHGLELLFKNEHLFKVGPQEGLAQNVEWLNYYINE